MCVCMQCIVIVLVHYISPSSKYLLWGLIVVPVCILVAIRAGGMAGSSAGAMESGIGLCHSCFCESDQSVFGYGMNEEYVPSHAKPLQLTQRQYPRVPGYPTAYIHSIKYYIYTALSMNFCKKYAPA